MTSLVPTLLNCLPTKVFAVHLNYRSRANERGRTPSYPSYFLKAPSSLAGSGDPLVRPRGCEYLAFEGEIVLVVGTRMHRVDPGDAWAGIAAVTAGNDAGVYDLRYADAGANVRSKSADGFTPIGPKLLAAAALDPTTLRVQTWVNGAIVQDADAGEFLFSLSQIIADLSRLSTLEPGDLILTGTPTGSSVVVPGDVIEVEVSASGLSTGRLTNTVAESDHELEPWGAMPKADDAARKAAFGSTSRLADQTRARLANVPTATLASQLRKRGYANITIDGVHPIRPGSRMVGTARTLRYLPLRDDQYAARGSGMNAQKRAIESVGPGEVLVMDARGEPLAGTIGDILALRAQVRGAAGVVTDGAVRDGAAIAALELPVFGAALHPSVLGRKHVPWDTDVPIACGNALVQPGDVLVGDDDGVVVIPPQLLDEVLADAEEQDRQERFIAAQVAVGASVDGLYPIGPTWQARYDAWVVNDDLSRSVERAI